MKGENKTSDQEYSRNVLQMYHITMLIINIPLVSFESIKQLWRSERPEYVQEICERSFSSSLRG